MKSFLIGLQFLTRISISKQTVWTEENFGRSVKFFPAIGAVVGIFSALIVGGFSSLTHGYFPIFTGALAFFLTAILTGGIHFDGLADSCDGLFSGREKEKILEIMKDSRSGSFGVLSLILISALSIAALIELSARSFTLTLAAIYSAPIIGRLMMVFVIGFFPYARESGTGKAFAKYTTKKTFAIALVETILLLTPIFFFDVKAGVFALISIFPAWIFARHFGNFATKKIGGVTGDIYGAVELISETIVSITFIFAI